MSAYQVGKLMFDLKKQEKLETFKKDPEAMMQAYGLSEEEKTFIRTKKSQPFFDAGIHPLLLGQGVRTLGLDPIMRMSLRASEDKTVADRETLEAIRKKFSLVSD